jgi:IS30 family transposase
MSREQDQRAVMLKSSLIQIAANLGINHLTVQRELKAGVALGHEKPPQPRSMTSTVRSSTSYYRGKRSTFFQPRHPGSFSDGS